MSIRQKRIEGSNPSRSSRGGGTVSATPAAAPKVAPAVVPTPAERKAKAKAKAETPKAKAPEKEADPYAEHDMANTSR